MKSCGHSFCGDAADDDDDADDDTGGVDGFFPTVLMASVHMAAVGDSIAAEVAVAVDVKSGFIVIGLDCISNDVIGLVSNSNGIKPMVRCGWMITDY